MYTYLLGWSKFNKFYYGVRYAKNSTPEELGVTYFSSSKYVKKFREENGPPDIIQIRKKFATRDKALLWEHKVLKRMKVVSSDKWLNKTDNIAIDFHSMTHNTLPGSVAGSAAVRGKTYEQIYGDRAEVYKRRSSETSKRNWADPEIRARMSKKPTDTSKIRAAALRRWAKRRA